MQELLELNLEKRQYLPYQTKVSRAPLGSTHYNLCMEGHFNLRYTPFNHENRKYIS